MVHRGTLLTQLTTSSRNCFGLHAKRTPPGYTERDNSLSKEIANEKDAARDVKSHGGKILQNRSSIIASSIRCTEKTIMVSPLESLDELENCFLL